MTIMARLCSVIGELMSNPLDPRGKIHIPIGTVKTYLHRAKAALKAGLEARERSLEAKGRLT